MMDMDNTTESMKDQEASDGSKRENTSTSLL